MVLQRATCGMVLQRATCGIVLQRATCGMVLQRATCGLQEATSVLINHRVTVHAVPLSTGTAQMEGGSEA